MIPKAPTSYEARMPNQRRPIRSGQFADPLPMRARLGPQLAIVEADLLRSY
jgi:hypothetical protein